MAEMSLEKLKSEQSKVQEAINNITEAADSFLLKNAIKKREINPFDIKIEELFFSNRVRICLLRGGINTLGELLQLSEKDLRKIKNLGSKCIEEIQKKLLNLGFYIGYLNFDDFELNETIKDIDRAIHLLRNIRSATEKILRIRV